MDAYKTAAEHYDYLFYIGRTRAEAFNTGPFDSYEVAVDCQTEYNLRARGAGKLPCSLYQVKVSAMDLDLT